MAFSTLRHISLLYRTIVPREGVPVLAADLTPPLFSQVQKASDLRPHIKSHQRFEHVIPGATATYWKTRHEIAARAFGLSVEGRLEGQDVAEDSVLLAERQILEQAIR
jgi:hypothetical protein